MRFWALYIEFMYIYELRNEVIVRVRVYVHVHWTLNDITHFSMRWPSQFIYLSFTMLHDGWCPRWELTSVTFRCVRFLNPKMVGSRSSLINDALCATIYIFIYIYIYLCVYILHICIFIYVYFDLTYHGSKESNYIIGIKIS